MNSAEKVKVVRLVVKGDGVKKGAQEAEEAVRSLGQASTKSGKEVQGFKQELEKTPELEHFKKSVMAATAVLGAATAAMAVQAKNAFAEYQSALTDLVKVTDANIQSLSEKIGGLPASLGNSTELTKGLYQTFSAGISAPNAALDVLTISSKAANAAHIQQAETIKVVTKLMAGYGDQLKGASDATDLLFAIEKAGQTSFAELVPVLGETAKISRDLGVSVNEMGAGLAQVTQFAGSTAQATTQLNQLFSELNKPTGELEKTFQRLGYSNGLEALEKKGFLGTLRMLQQETDFSTAKFKALFGSLEAGKAAAAIADQDFSGFNDRLRIMAERTGETERFFQNWQGTLEGLSFTLKNEVNNALIELGREIAPQVQEMLKETTKFVQENKQQLIDLTKQFLKLAETIGPLVPDMLALYGSFKVSQGMIKLVDWSQTLTGTLMKNSDQLSAMGLHLAGMSKEADKAKFALMSLNTVKLGLAGMALYGAYKGFEWIQEEGRRTAPIRDARERSTWENSKSDTGVTVKDTNLADINASLEQYRQKAANLKTVTEKDLQDISRAYESIFKTVSAKATKELQERVKAEAKGVETILKGRLAAQEEEANKRLELEQKRIAEENRQDQHIKELLLSEYDMEYNLLKKQQEKEEKQHQKRLQQVEELARIQQEYAQQLQAQLQSSVVNIGFDILEGKDKANRGQNVGSSAGSLLGMFLGGPAMGALFGQIGSRLGGMLGSFFDQQRGAQSFAEQLDAATQSLADFQQGLVDSNRTNAERVDLINQNQTNIANWQAQIQALEASRESAVNSAPDPDNAAWIGYEIDAQISALQQQILDATENNQSLTEEILRWNQEAKNSIRDLQAARTQFGVDYLNQQKTTAENLADLASVRRQLRRYLEMPTGLNDAEQAQWNQQKLDLLQEEWRIQQVLIQAKQDEISAVKNSKTAWENSLKDLQAFAQGVSRRNWGMAEYQQLYTSNLGVLGDLNPASQQAQDLLQEQVRLLQTMEGLQQEQLISLKDTAANTAKLIEDLKFSDLNLTRNLSDELAKYQDLRTKAMNGDAAAGQEMGTFARQLLGQAKGYYKSSADYQALYDQILGDLGGVQTSFQQSQQGLAGSFDFTSQVAQLEGVIQAGTTSLDGTIQNLDQVLRRFIANLNQEATPLNLALGPGFAEGGISSGPTSGHLELLHGTEAVIPLGRGALPLVVQGGGNATVEAKLAEQNRLMGELIDLIRAGQNTHVQVTVDGAELAEQAVRLVSEGSRRGIVPVGAR